MATWLSEIEVLTSISVTHPQAVYTAYTHSLFSKWTYHSRVASGVESPLSAMETFLRVRFLPLLSGQPLLGDVLRHLLALPAHFGGLGIMDPAQEAQYTYGSSTAVAP